MSWTIYGDLNKTNMADRLFIQAQQSLLMRSEKSDPDFVLCWSLISVKTERGIVSAFLYFYSVRNLAQSKVWGEEASHNNDAAFIEIHSDRYTKTWCEFKSRTWCQEH